MYISSYMQDIHRPNFERYYYVTNTVYYVGKLKSNQILFVHIVKTGKSI